MSSRFPHHRIRTPGWLASGAEVVAVGGAGWMARPSGSTGTPIAGLGPTRMPGTARPAGEVTQVSRVRAPSLPARDPRSRTRPSRGHCSAYTILMRLMEICHARIPGPRRCIERDHLLADQRPACPPVEPVDPPALRHQRLLRRGDEGAAAGEYLQGPAQHDQEGCPARPVDRRRRRRHDAGMGHGARRDALHPLVPADDRADRREARLVPGPDRGRARPSPSSAARSWSGASPTPRASPRAASAPPSRPAATPPGTRPAPRSSWRTPTARPCASRRPSAPGPARPSTRRPPCSARWRPSPSTPSASSGSSAPTPRGSTARPGPSRSTS